MAPLLPTVAARSPPEALGGPVMSRTEVRCTSGLGTRLYLGYGVVNRGWRMEVLSAGGWCGYRLQVSALRVTGCQGVRGSGNERLLAALGRLIQGVERRSIRIGARRLGPWP